MLLYSVFHVSNFQWSNGCGGKFSDLSSLYGYWADQDTKYLGMINKSLHSAYVSIIVMFYGF
jgi:hypothetical protein